MLEPKHIEWTAVHSSVRMRRFRRVVYLSALLVVGAVYAIALLGETACDCTRAEQLSYATAFAVMIGGLVWWAMLGHRQTESVEYSTHGLRFLRGQREVVVRWTEVQGVYAHGFGAFEVRTPAGRISLAMAMAEDWQAFVDVAEANSRDRPAVGA
jgi:hypothetical protein